MAIKKKVAKAKPAAKVAKKPVAKTKNKPAKKATVKKTAKAKPIKKVSAKPAKKVVKKAIAKKVVKPAKKALKKAVAKQPVKKTLIKKVVIKKAVVKKAIAKLPQSKPVKKAVVVKAKPMAKVIAKPVVKAPVTRPVNKPAYNAPVVKAAAPVFRPIHSTPLPQTKTSQTKNMNVQKTSVEDTRSRYSDAELKEFKVLVVQKLDEARIELVNLNATVINANENGTDDTGASFKMLEDGSDSLAKEESAQLAIRQKKFVEQLEAALQRIENKTYGICRVTGKLIAKERLRAVPHTTQSMEAKLKQYRD